MLANSKSFWVFTGGLLLISCLFKGWLVNRDTLINVNDIALTRAALDPMLDTELRPRVLIAGGSNALSGYDSTIISRATGIPTFNLGLLNEGYHYLNTFQIIESRARSRDIVLLSTIRLVIAPPDQAANMSIRIIGNDRWQVPQLASPLSISAGEYLPPMASLFAGQTFIRMLLMWLQPHGTTLIKDDSAQVARLNPDTLGTEPLAKKITNELVFDERGDWINCIVPKNPRPILYDPAMAEQSEKYLAALDQFAGRLKARGVTLRITPATILVQRNDMPLWREQYLAISRALHIAVLLPIDPSRQLLTDSTRFCDTNAHLLRSQIADNNQAVVEAVKNLTDNQAIIEPVKNLNDDGAV